MKKRAYTLIELLVVIAIISIVTAMTIAALVVAKNRRQVRVVAEKIQSMLITAHNDAIANRNDAPAGTSVTKITIDSSVSPKKVKYQNVAGTATIDITSYDILNSNITFSNDTDIYFEAQNSNRLGELDISDTNRIIKAGDGIITLTGTNSQVYQLKVNRYTGNVDICQNTCS